MNRCASPEELARLLAGELTAPECEALDNHLGRCPGCQRALAELSDGENGSRWRRLAQAGALSQAADRLPDDLPHRWALLPGRRRPSLPEIIPKLPTPALAGRLMKPRTQADSRREDRPGQQAPAPPERGPRRRGVAIS
jgi:anti-sigma factor RsiW